MKKIISFFLVIFLTFFTVNPVDADDIRLYAKSAILMEVETEEIMYGKSEKVFMQNASTTKIMTCIYILNHCNINDWAKVSSNAASQPRVRLGVHAGEKYRVKDMLYGMMLESFNDCAVVLAEYAAGSVENFSKKINREATKMGAKSTHFVTPNGLDAFNAEGAHGTTAYDLAIIMSKCIKNQSFLNITRKESYSFQDSSGKREFTCVNHNALLRSMDGVISGKTGYTSKAGYCYVGAVEKDGIKMIVVVLGSGWPPHKSYKWSDVKSLINYGTSQYEYRNVKPDISKIRKIPVNHGTKKYVSVRLSEDEVKLFLRKKDKIEISCKIIPSIDAPIKKGDVIGKIQYNKNKKCVHETMIISRENIAGKDYWWYFGELLKDFMI